MQPHGAIVERLAVAATKLSAAQYRQHGIRGTVVVNVVGKAVAAAVAAVGIESTRDIVDVATSRTTTGAVIEVVAARATCTMLLA